MAFHFLDEYMEKIITTMIRPKLECAEVIWSILGQQKAYVEIGKNTENSNKDGARFGRLNMRF